MVEYPQMISVAQTPNPHARQFSTGKPFFSVGSYAFYNTQEAQKCPMAGELLTLKTVSHVLITPLFVTVALVDEALWNTQESSITAIITKHTKNDASIIQEDQTPQETASQSGDLYSTVEALLEKHANPAVTEHGGRVQLVKIEDGVVYLELQGACDGCPSALVTLKTGIENLLCFYVPSIKEVRATNLNI